MPQRANSAHESAARTSRRIIWLVLDFLRAPAVRCSPKHAEPPTGSLSGAHVHKVVLGGEGSSDAALAQDPFNGALAHGVPLRKLPLGRARDELRRQPAQLRLAKPVGDALLNPCPFRRAHTHAHRLPNAPDPQTLHRADQLRHAVHLFRITYKKVHQVKRGATPVGVRPL